MYLFRITLNTKFQWLTSFLNLSLGKFELEKRFLNKIYFDYLTTLKSIGYEKKYSYCSYLAYG